MELAKSFQTGFNLWVYYDHDSHTFTGVSGKRYILSGNREDKIPILKQLAKSDFLSNRVFTIYGESNPNKLIPLTYKSEIFEELWSDLAKSQLEIDKQNQGIAPLSSHKNLDSEHAPLCVITILTVYGNGSIELHFNEDHSCVDLERQF